jgi:uncharacterized phiE125 gp8 family phage protein
MPLTLITPPLGEPVTLADARAYLKLDTSDDDALVNALITAARARAEWHTGRALMTQSWTLWLDAWPPGGVIDIALPPLRAVTSITTYARDDAPAVLDPARTVVDLAGNRIALRPTTVLPPLLRNINAVAIAFTAGYGAAPDVPQQIQSFRARELFTGAGKAQSRLSSGRWTARYLEPQAQTILNTSYPAVSHLTAIVRAL